MIRFTPAVGLVVLLFVTGATSASELNDSWFGFRLVLPEGFTKLELDPSETDTLYKFADRDLTPDDPAHVIQIQRLRGVISPTARMKESDLPIIEGITTTLQEFSWKGLQLDVTRQAISLPNGINYVVFGIQYPLSGEAIQLQVGGPEKDETEVYSVFSTIAEDFENTKPLHSFGSVSFRKLSTGERIQKLISGILQLTVTSFVIVFLFRILKRQFTEKKRSK